jgi:hypothetical protein
MSNQALVTITEVPAYLAAYAAQHGAALAAVNDAAMGGLSVGMPPTISLNGTRFVVKEGGEDKTLNQLELQCVVLKAKPGIDKQWYATKFVPGQEPSGPDCFSVDGMTPDSTSPMKQHNSCGGCAHNQFGSATDNSGNAMKGKACQDSKVIAIFANGGVYRFKIPAASLRNFVAYVKQLQSHNLPLPAVITTLGFDPSVSYPLLTFKAQGALGEAQFKQVVARIDSPETDDALMVKPSAQAQLAAPAPEPLPVVDTDVTSDLGFDTAPAATATVKAKAPAKPKLVPTPPPVAEEAIIAQPVAAAQGPSADELSAALGL